MDWLQFTASVIGSVAWPVAAIALGLIFRAQFRRLLEKMTKFKGPGGIEASFAHEAEAVAAETAKFGTPTAIQGPPAAKPRAPIRQELAVQYKSEERPSAVIVTVWQKIESLIVDLLDLKKIDQLPTDMRYWNVSVAIEDLVRANVIEDKTADVLHSLFKLRNWVAHNDFEPEERATREFFVASERVIKLLEATIEKLLTE
jgi:hypothetical protein